MKTNAEEKAIVKHCCRMTSTMRKENDAKTKPFYEWASVLPCPAYNARGLATQSNEYSAKIITYTWLFGVLYSWDFCS